MPVPPAPKPETAMVGITPVRSLAERIDALVQTWGALAYIAATTAGEVAFIELYCRWHGAKFLTLDLYTPQNIAALAKIGFVGGTPPSPMSMIAEVLMWSSLGVWATRAFTMITRYEGKRINPPHDLADYIGTLIRNTSVAAIIITLLNVSKFQVFGQSVNNFETTAGLSFLLGFFGDDAYRLICVLRDKAFAKLGEPHKEG